MRFVLISAEQGETDKPWRLEYNGHIMFAKKVMIQVKSETFIDARGQCRLMCEGKVFWDEELGEAVII